MKTLLRTLTLILGLWAGAAFAQPAIITQGSSDTFLAFEAEHFAYVSNSLPTFWVVKNDVPATGTPASGGRAIYQSGEPQSTGMSSSFAYYALKFSTPGTYSLYVRWRADKARSDQDGNGGNSYRRPSDFGDLPNDATSSLFPTSSANNTRVPPDANKYAMIKEGATYAVTQEQIDTGEPLLFKIGTREWGMFLDRFVFSPNANLTEPEFNATPNSGAAARPTIDKAVGSASLTDVTIAFSKALAPDSADPTFFTLSGGLHVNTATLDAADSKIIHLTTDPQTQGVNYTVTVNRVSDVGGTEILPNSTVHFTAWKLVAGWLTRDFYYNVAGADVASLLAAPKYPDNADAADLVQNIEFENSPWANNYGVRFTTFFTPSKTDFYDFYIYSDDEAALRTPGTPSAPSGGW